MSWNPFSLLYRAAYNAVSRGVADALRDVTPEAADYESDRLLTLGDLRTRLAIAGPPAEEPEAESPKARGGKGGAK